MGRLRQGLLGLAVAVVLLVAVPAALVHLGGAPRPSTVTAQLAAGAQGWAWLLAWLGWLGASGAAARDLARAMSADPMVRARAGLVGGALAALLSLTAPAGASSPQRPGSAGSVAAVPAALAERSTSHLVLPGESLWSIAEAELDDPTAWTAIWALNAGNAMGSGQRLVDPSLIYPGWSLALPPGPAAPASSPVPRPRPRAAAPTMAAVGPVLAQDVARSPGRWLPGGLAAAGGSVLALTLLGGWLARRRRSLGDQVAAAWAALDDPLLDQLEGLDQLRDAPMLDRVASAWAAVLELGLEDDVLAIGVGNDGCEALLGGASAPRRRQLPARSSVAELPALLCLGDDERTSWVAPLLPGRVVALSGPGARQVLRAATAQLAWWPWTEELVVTAEASLARRELARRGHGGVVFTGDPAQLGAQERARLAVVTAAPVEALDHVLRCELSDDGLQVAGLELGRPDPSPALIAHATDLDGLAPRCLGLLQPEAEGVAPCVRLLTPRPRVEGLAEALPEARERKATELIAYLATHAPAEVAGDRLRARILGRRDGDGTAKTLANVASVARRALGAAYLPPAGASAAYRVVGVATDLELMARLVDEAEASTDPALRVALLREALALVEGEPCSGVLAGYQWWRSEGHAARAGALATSAAWSLVDDAIGEGSVELAAWGLAKAALVEPHAESLLRAEMVLAGIAGDPDALRAAFTRCADLDGGLPSAAAQRTFETVSARLRAPRR